MLLKLVQDPVADEYSCMDRRSSNGEPSQGSSGETGVTGGPESDLRKL